jgi:hypothetical protein
MAFNLAPVDNPVRFIALFQVLYFQRCEEGQNSLCLAGTRLQCCLHVQWIKDNLFNLLTQNFSTAKLALLLLFFFIYRV